MIVGEVSKGILPLRGENGVALHFDYQDRLHSLSLTDEEMDAIAVSGLAGKKQRQLIKPTLVFAGHSDAPSHQINATYVLADMNGVDAVVALRTIDEDDFSGTVFRATRSADKWSMQATHETTSDVDHMKWLASTMAYEAIDSATATHRHILRLSESDLFSRSGIPVNTTSIEN